MPLILLYHLVVKVEDKHLNNQKAALVSFVKKNAKKVRRFRYRTSCFHRLLVLDRRRVGCFCSEQYWPIYFSVFFL